MTPSRNRDLIIRNQEITSMNNATQQHPPYPLLVRLDGRRVVVVGAGTVARRKVEAMVEYGARVNVIAPEADDAIKNLASEGRVVWKQRPYVEGDLVGAALAFIATGDANVNAAAQSEAVRLGILVNVVDVPELCTCIVPSIMRRGQLQVAVSTNGAAPSMARRIRHELEERFPLWWEDYIDMLANVRTLVKEHVPGPASARAPLFEALSTAGLERRIEAGEKLAAQDVFDEIVAPHLTGSTR